MSVTHPVGLSKTVNQSIVGANLVASVCGLLALVVLNAVRHHGAAGTSSIVYGVSLCLCSLCSYLYTIRWTTVPTPVLRQLDHAAIFFLVAGTYTPFASSLVNGPFGIRLLHWVWGTAFVGATFRLIVRQGYDRLFVGLYILQGWLFLTALPSIIDHVDSFSMWFLAIGAVTYSLGAAIFARDIGRWTDPVWHAFVFSASVLHFVAVLGLVLHIGTT